MTSRISSRRIGPSTWTGLGTGRSPFTTEITSSTPHDNPLPALKMPPSVSKRSTDQETNQISNEKVISARTQVRDKNDREAGVNGLGENFWNQKSSVLPRPIDIERPHNCHGHAELPLVIESGFFRKNLGVAIWIERT